MSGLHIALDQPSAWVVRFASLIGAGEVLDLACGGGRHARFLAQRGHQVLAVDRNPLALASLAGDGLMVQQVDLETGLPNAWPFPPKRFAAIVVTNYLHRPLFPKILDSLAADGVLLYETFAEGNEQFGKPSNPEFLLMPGELLSHVQGTMRIIAFEDGYVEQPKPAMVQRICAVKTAGHVDHLKLHLI